MRSVKIVRIIMLVAAFTLPLNAQQPHRDQPVLATAGAQGTARCEMAITVHAQRSPALREQPTRN